MLLAALATAKRALPAYSHRYSPKKFTQQQLFACLVLKSFLKVDYRGVTAHLTDCASLPRDTRPLRSSPLHDAAESSAAIVGLATRPAVAGCDGAGAHGSQAARPPDRDRLDRLESSAASGYFVRRRDTSRIALENRGLSSLPKLGVVCDVEVHLILAAQDGRGPKPDVADFRPLRRCGCVSHIDRMAADAGFDSEANHTFARQECHIRSIIPAKHGRPTTKPASGHYRRLMQTRFDIDAYRDRVQVETVISMLKRRLEAVVLRPLLLEPMPRASLESPHPQRHDSLTYQGFLQSNPRPI